METNPRRWASTSTGRIVVIGVLCLALLVPLLLVTNLVNERLATRHEAEHRVSRSFGYDQTVGGPVLVVPYQLRVVDRQVPERYGPMRYLYVLPEELQIDAGLGFEERRVGLYDVTVYRTALSVSGHFSPIEVEPRIPDDARVHWQRAQLLLPLTDPRGLRGVEHAVLGTETLTFRPAGATDWLLAGVLAPVFRNEEPANGPLAFRIDLSVAGTGSLKFLPLGRRSVVELEGPWPDPSFIGNYLPRDYAIDQGAFSAQWEVLELNRSYGQMLLAGGNLPHLIDASAFGFALYEAAGPYQQVTRSLKYGLLFIALTFVTFFVLEVRLAVRLHPVQYLLVGLGMCSFYLLLLSVSEHLGFGAAYALATVALVTMLTAYAGTILAQRGFGLLLGAGVGMLYGILYVLLRLEELSLLLGSLLVFAIVALAMYVTRDVDWYAVGDGGDEGPDGRPAAAANTA